MSRQFRFVARRIGLVSSLIPPLCLLLSACGGGGGGMLAMPIVPPPPSTPAPTPPPDLPAGTVIVPPSTLFTALPGSIIDVQRSWLDSPATRVGNSGLIGRLTIDPGTGNPADWTFRPVVGGEFTMTVSNGVAGGFNYALNAPTGLLPAGLTTLEVQSPGVSWDLNLPPSNSFRYLNGYGDDRQFFGQRLTAFAKAPDGTEKQFVSYDLTRAVAGSKPLVGDNYQLQATLNYDVGYSYVAMGEWSWPVLLNGNPTNATNFGKLLFVNGDRTPTSGIPASGTATYDARSLEMLSSTGVPGIPFTLTADFGLRTIATRIDQDFANFGSGPDSSPIQGIHVGGSAPFGNDGSFDIPLTGTVNYSYQNQPTPPPGEAATGDMNGAFFGPNAQEIGGTFSIQRSTDRLPLYQDAFVGQQRPH
jgi:hypothetical protein